MWYLPRPRTPPCTVLKRNKKIKIHKNETKPNPETDTETETELRLEKNIKQWKPNWAAQSGSDFPLSLSPSPSLPYFSWALSMGRPPKRQLLLICLSAINGQTVQHKRIRERFFFPAGDFTRISQIAPTLSPLPSPPLLLPFAQRDQDELSLPNSENCNAKIP